MSSCITNVIGFPHEFSIEISRHLMFSTTRFSTIKNLDPKTSLKLVVLGQKCFPYAFWPNITNFNDILGQWICFDLSRTWYVEKMRRRELEMSRSFCREVVGESLHHNIDSLHCMCPEFFLSHGQSRELPSGQLIPCRSLSDCTNSYILSSSSHRMGGCQQASWSILSTLLRMW